jgi:hypothetical protein
MINILHKAVRSLYPNAVEIFGNDINSLKIFDIDGNKIEVDNTAITTWNDPEAYKELRAKEYPSYADQFDTIFHEGIDAWKAQIQAVKDKYPKV